MPKVEANQTNCQCNVNQQGHAQAARNKQEIASEIYPQDHIKQVKSKTNSGNQTNEQDSQVESERTAWN
ncbi:hypothetical protein D1B33_12230 [Lysinibacillus yapensis]|uniref:Uncharacterized protein n=1 Tax=Ureibacillus yapensis TaxID=2304605 RepID=A0A396S6B6_9BACL|nr:hypothetical protein [Lysinibacillus yapensis]RHW35861.1 hypothetical protein D1B33_12230 [Lysinibacillus yapensis]